jgi:hypothetical protein
LWGKPTLTSFQSPTKRVGSTLVTRIQVKNRSAAPISELKVSEFWYDKTNGLIPGSQMRVINGLLQPGRVGTLEIRTPENAKMVRSLLQFSHANGTVKPHPVESFDATGATTAATAQTARPLVRSGQFDKHSFTYEEQKGFGSFFFEPSLPADDAVVLRAMRALLTDAYKVNLRNAPEPKTVGRFMRFITGDGVFDCLVAKDTQLRVLAISVIRKS